MPVKARECFSVIKLLLTDSVAYFGYVLVWIAGFRRAYAVYVEYRPDALIPVCAYLFDYRRVYAGQMLISAA